MTEDELAHFLDDFAGERQRILLRMRRNAVKGEKRMKHKSIHFEVDCNTPVFAKASVYVAVQLRRTYVVWHLPEVAESENGLTPC